MHYTHGGFVAQNLIPVLLAIICTFLVAAGITIYRPSFLRVVACIIAGPGMLALALCIDFISTEPLSLDKIIAKLRHSRGSLRMSLRLPYDLIDNYIIPMLSVDFRSSYSDHYNQSGMYNFENATVDLGLARLPRHTPIIHPPTVGSSNPDSVHLRLQHPNDTSCTPYLGGYTFVTPTGFFALASGKIVQLPIRHRLQMIKMDHLIIIRHKSKRYTILNPANSASYEFQGEYLPTNDQYTLSLHDIGLREDPKEEIAS